MIIVSFIGGNGHICDGPTLWEGWSAYVLCAPWMVNIAHEFECSKGWKSRKRRGRARKPSKWQAGSPWGVQWSKPDCGVCTDEQKLHTEAIRSDEVSHAAEVQSLPFFILERKDSTEIVDVAVIGIRMFTLPREVSNYRVWFEKSAEAIVVTGNKPR